MYDILMILIFSGSSLFSGEEKNTMNILQKYNPATAPRWAINLTALWVSQLLVLSGFAAMSPFIPLFIKNHLHVTDPSELASAITMYNVSGTLGYAIFCPIWGRLADRVGVKPMLLRGTFLTCFIFPLMAYSANTTWLVILRFLSAACAGTTAASQIMLVRTTPEHRQGFAIGTLTTAIWGGSVLGNVIGGAIIHYYNYEYAFWFCGITYVLAGLAVLVTKDEKTAAAKKQPALRGKFTLIPRFTHGVWILLGLFVLYGFIRSVEAPFISLKIEMIVGAEKAAYYTGIISAAVCAGAIVSGIVCGYLVDKIPANKLLVPLMLVSATAMALQGITDSALVFAIGRVLLFFAAGGLHPLINKVLANITPKRKRGSVFGASSTGNYSGSMLAIMLGGAIFSFLSVNATFYAGALCFLISTPLFLKGIEIASRKTAFHRR